MQRRAAVVIQSVARRRRRNHNFRKKKKAAVTVQACVRRRKKLLQTVADAEVPLAATEGQRKDHGAPSPPCLRQPARYPQPPSPPRLRQPTRLLQPQVRPVSRLLQRRRQAARGADADTSAEVDTEAWWHRTMALHERHPASPKPLTAASAISLRRLKAHEEASPRADTLPALYLRGSPLSRLRLPTLRPVSQQASAPSAPSASHALSHSKSAPTGVSLEAEHVVSVARLRSKRTPIAWKPRWKPLVFVA